MLMVKKKVLACKTCLLGGEGRVEGQISDEVMMRRTVVLLCKQSKRQTNRQPTDHKPMTDRNNPMTITVTPIAERDERGGIAMTYSLRGKARLMRAQLARGHDPGDEEKHDHADD